MADPVVKIINVDRAKLVSASPGDRAELTLTAEIVHEKARYTRKYTLVLDEHLIEHIGGPVGMEQIERLLLNESDKIKSLHELAAACEAAKGQDLVAKMRRQE